MNYWRDQLRPIWGKIAAKTGQTGVFPAKNVPFRCNLTTNSAKQPLKDPRERLEALGYGFTTR